MCRVTPWHLKFWTTMGADVGESFNSQVLEVVSEEDHVEVTRGKSYNWHHYICFCCIPAVVADDEDQPTLQNCPLLGKLNMQHQCIHPIQLPLQIWIEFWDSHQPKPSGEVGEGTLLISLVITSAYLSTSTSFFFQNMNEWHVHVIFHLCNYTVCISQLPTGTQQFWMKF